MRASLNEIREHDQDVRRSHYSALFSYMHIGMSREGRVKSERKKRLLVGSSAFKDAFKHLVRSKSASAHDRIKAMPSKRRTILPQKSLPQT